MGCGKSKPADVATGNVTQKKKSFSKIASKKDDTNQTNPKIAAKSESTSSSSSDSTNISNQQQESEMAISKEDPGTQNVAGVTEKAAAIKENVAGVTENVAAITQNVASVTENVAGVIENASAITQNVKGIEDVPQTERAKEGEVVGSKEQKEREVENVGGDVGQYNVESVEGMTFRDSTNSFSSSFSSARKEEETFDSVASEVKSGSASPQIDNSSSLVVKEAEKIGDAMTVVETNGLAEKTQPEAAAEETDAPKMISGTSGSGDTLNLAEVDSSGHK